MLAFRGRETLGGAAPFRSGVLMPQAPRRRNLLRTSPRIRGEARALHPPGGGQGLAIPASSVRQQQALVDAEQPAVAEEMSGKAHAEERPEGGVADIEPAGIGAQRRHDAAGW